MKPNMGEFKKRSETTKQKVGAIYHISCSHNNKFLAKNKILS